MGPIRSKRRTVRINPWSVAKGLYSGYKFMNKFRGKSNTSTRGKAKEYGNITFQQDERTIYRRKRAPKRVRRAHRKAYKNFLYNLDKVQSMKTCVINDSVNRTVTPTGYADGQMCVGITLYGYGENTFAANTNTANGDMPWIFARENGAYPVSSLASRKLRFRSAILDIDIYNGGSDLVLLDVYHVLCRKTAKNVVGVTGDPQQFWNEAISMQAAGNMPAGILANTHYGVTPFDSGDFGQGWIIKSVRKIRLSAGQWYSNQIRDPGNYTLRMEDVLEMNCSRNLTEGFIFVVRNPDITASVPDPLNVTFRYTKKYHYTETSSSIDAIGS